MDVSVLEDVMDYCADDGFCDVTMTVFESAQSTKDYVRNGTPS